MSILSKLDIANLRNISTLGLQLSPAVNLIHGENGSGKTSILEAAFLLASGRSFRTSKIDSLIAETHREVVIYGETSAGHRVGFSKQRRQSHQLRLDGQSQRNWDQVARELPIQILDANSFALLEGGPKARRRFLDWGVFHVEPGFVESWRRTSKSIANRNFLLKQGRLDSTQLEAWDGELASSAERVDQARRAYIDQFYPVFREVYVALATDQAESLSLHYERGWDPERDLAAVLREARQADHKYGVTQNGPHRADIVFRQGNRLAAEVLSRGQQKILVSALKIAQGILLGRARDRHCIYLVDDLPAELDPANRARVLDMLLSLGGQLFLTCVERSALQASLSDSSEMAAFHVERGTITS